MNDPKATARRELTEREPANVAVKLAEQGHLVRLRHRTAQAPVAGRAYDEASSIACSARSRLYDWMHVTMIPRETQPGAHSGTQPMSTQLHAPRLTRMFRPEATLRSPQDFGKVASGHASREVLA